MLGLLVLMLDARLVKRPRQRPGGQTTTKLRWYLVRPRSAERPLAAEGRAARASGGGELGGDARKDRRSPADERPAQTMVQSSTAVLKRYEQRAWQ
jgi:hypothetical protein